ncbi:MAG: hypothetical protein Kow00124_30160 [Anaerolineae bacterium]
MKDIIRQFVNIVAFLGMVTVNGLANTLPLNNIPTNEISDSFPNLFVPAGYVFAIWGVIYLALLGFTVYQALPSQRENPALRRLGYWFAISSVFNIAWLFAWHWLQFPLSLGIMIGLLISLIVIYLRLGIGRTSYTGIERWTLQVPFSIYLGWITVATIANASVVLLDAGWNAFGISPVVWAVVMLLIAAGLSIYITWTRREVAYTLVIIWALAGIVVAQMETPVVAITAGVLAGVVALSLVISATRGLRAGGSGVQATPAAG